MADEIRYGVGFDPDRASAERAAEVPADALEEAMLAALKKFDTESRRSAGRLGKALGDDPGVRRFRVNMEGITEELKDAANAGSRFAGTFSSDLRSLEVRARAVQDALAKSGSNTGLGASIQVQLRKALELQRDFEQDSLALASDPKTIRAYENRFDVIRTALLQDVKFSSRVLEQQSQREIAELNQRNQAAAAAARERNTILNAERSRNVVAQQREGALELEEARRTSRLKLQDERASARQRLAIIQAVSQQIRALERGISAGLRGVGSVLGGIAGGVSSATSRITGIFRRSDAQMNAGLQPALERRTSIFRREMRQTEQVIQSSVVRQSRLFAQAEVQASRGLAGVASGRSQAGALLGGGLAIGGTFALLTKLKQGFEESVNLNESLNKTRQIFGDATAEILTFADSSVEALFVTKSAALEAAANFGIFGKSAGLAGPELAGFSKTLNVLATDLASFNNTTISDATTAIAAALRGESEPIRRYGVLLNEAVLQNRALAEGITDTIRKLTPQERVLAANAEILAQTVVQQGDAARTANDFANSSRRAAAASTEFFASIARFAVPFATLLTNGILPVFVTLTALVNDEVGPALSILRDGLIGAGAALGGLLAAKAAGEALKFLALGLRAVLSPIGLLVTAVALVGAAVNILASRSPALNAALGQLRETVGDLVASGLALAADLFRRLADVVIDRLLPAVTRLSLFLARNLQSAFRDSVEFVEGRVLPVLERFGRFVRDRVLPPLLEFAQLARDRIAQGLDIARRAAVEFFDAIRPFIAPLVEGFRNLGDAVRDALGGDFSGALERLQSFGREAVLVAGAIGAGIALAFVNPLLGIGVTIAALLGVAFGPRLLDALRPQAEGFGRFLRDLFSVDNLADVGVGFLRVVRRIGEIIGSIVTDRRFVTALAAIAAAIAATAGAALIGFADGVRQNIPELIDLLGDALRLAFREAFKFALSNPEIILGVIAGAAVLGAIRRAFAAVGAAGASSFGASFLAGTRAFFQRNAFNQGLFGGVTGLEAAAAKQASREAAALSKARTAAFRDVGLLAGAGLTIPATLLPGVLGPEDPLKQLDAVRTKLGAVQTAGALFRTNIDQAFASAGVSAGGFARILSGDVVGGFDQVKTGAAGLRTNITQMFSRLKTDLKAAAGGLGQALGGAIASGVGAALSGQALGTAESGVGAGIGLAGIVASALFAGSVAGAPAGVAVASIGLVTAALAANEKATQRAKDEMNEYADSLRNAKSASDAFSGITSVIEQNLKDESDAVVEILSRTSFSFEGFSRQILNDSVNARRPILEFFRSVGPEGAAALKFLEDNVDIDTFSELKDVLSASGTGGSRAFIDGINAAGFSAGEFRDVLDFLGDESGELQGSLDRVDLEKAFRTDPVVRGLDSVTSRVDGLRGAVTEFPVGGGLLQFLQGESTDLAQRRLEEVTEAVEDVGLAVDVLNQQRTDRINAQIEDVSTALGAARDAAELARDSVTSFFTGREGTSAQLTDQLLGGLSGTGTAIGEAIALGTQSALGGAALRTALDGFGSSVAGIVQQAVTDNSNITTAELSALLDPVRAGISQAAALDTEDMFTPEAAQTLIDNINSFLGAADLQAAIDFSGQLQADADALQEQWNALDVALDADVVFSRDQIRAALVSALDLTGAEASSILDAANISNVFTSGFDEMGVVLGTSTVEGYARGITEGTAVVETAVTGLANVTQVAMERGLRIGSPSKVFDELGREIPAGLAQGIAATSPAAHAAALNLASQLTGVLTGEDFEDSFLSGLDSFIGRVGSLGDALGSALETGGEIGASAAREAFVGLDEQVRELLQRGIAEGSVFDTASARAALGPLFRALTQGAALDPEDLFTDAVARQLQARISDTLSGLDIGALSGASGLLVGETSAERKDSNAGRFAEQIRQLIQIFVNSQMAHPAGWIQTEDGSWVPPSFFDPPAALGVGSGAGAVDMREGTVPNQPAHALRIDNVNITEATSARATGRETIMALKTAAITATPLATANRVPVDVSPG